MFSLSKINIVFPLARRFETKLYFVQEDKLSATPDMTWLLHGHLQR